MKLQTMIISIDKMLYFRVACSTLHISLVYGVIGPGKDRSVT
jgi:hypothetical protein